MPTYNYTRIRPVDLLQVGTDQGMNTTLTAAIAAIQAAKNLTYSCPKCVVNGSPTGWNTQRMSNQQLTQVLCTVCAGNLKTSVPYIADPNSAGNYVVLGITGGDTVIQGQTLQLSSNVANGQWASSNQNVATVNQNSGLVNGVAAGNCNITYTVNDVVATQALTVTAN